MTYDATMKKGWGFWETTHYPRGGDFKRSVEDTRVHVVRKADAISKWEYHVEWIASDGKRRTACADHRGIVLDEAQAA